MYEPRFYQSDFIKEWFSLKVAVSETDLLVKSKLPLEESSVVFLVKKFRKEIEDYILKHGKFKTALFPLPAEQPCPRIVYEMAEKSSLAGVGPMASVAGAVAEFLGRELIPKSPELLVENGGDIFIKKQGNIKLSLYAGKGSFVNGLTFLIENKDGETGICSSSSFLGHSLSFGNADLTTVISPSAVFADALATKLANMVHGEEDVGKALEFAKSFSLTRGVLAVKGEKIGIWGDIQIGK